MERRMKISPKLLIIAAVILVVVIGVAAWLNGSNQSRGDSNGNILIICVDGEEKVAYSLDEIMSMKKATVYAELQSTNKGDDAEGDFSGVTLRKLLKDAGVSGYYTIVFTAGDGYSSAATASEAKDVLVAYEKDGDALGDYAKGGTGPLQCIFFKDTYGNRSVQNLTKIDCKIT